MFKDLKKTIFIKRVFAPNQFSISLQPTRPSSKLLRQCTPFIWQEVWREEGSDDGHQRCTIIMEPGQCRQGTDNTEQVHDQLSVEQQPDKLINHDYNDSAVAVCGSVTESIELCHFVN